MNNQDNSIINFTLEDVGVTRLKTNRLALYDADRVKFIIPDRIWKRKKENEIKGISDIYMEEPLVITETKAWIQEITSQIEDPILFCFSDKPYNVYRSKVAFEKEYKGNRKEKKEYREYEGKAEDAIAAAKYVIENCNSVFAEGLEADDILSFLQDKDNTYIISNDKDLKQIPGYHFNQEILGLEEVTEMDALKMLCMQLLKGDPTDNIQGIDKIGDKKALAFVNSPNFNPALCFQQIMYEYQKAHKSKTKGVEAFCENFMLIKMKTDRGAYFKSKYQHVYDLKEYLLNQMRENNLKQ
jgi:hypothetical protein